MIKALFSTVAAGATLVAIPAFAADRADPAPVAAQEPQQRPATRYCVQGPTTGTILQNKVCRTRAEWLKRGIDPIAK